jgi:hypothetical protein
MRTSGARAAELLRPHVGSALGVSREGRSVQTLGPIPLSILLLGACNANTSPGSPAVDAERNRLRDRARIVLEENCGSCHLPGLPTSRDAALAVYDLSELEWAARMSERQLKDAESRLASDLAPSAGDGTPMTVTDADRLEFKRYVELEVASRRSGPNSP